MTIYSTTMKQKLFWVFQKITSICARLFKLSAINLVLLVALIIVITNTVEKALLWQFNLRYLESMKHKMPDMVIASHQLEDDFTSMMSKHNLNVSANDVVYDPVKEGQSANVKAVKASYNIALEGTYMNFLRYLQDLKSQNMINNISSLSLEIQSSELLDIKLKMDCIYDQ